MNNITRDMLRAGSKVLDNIDKSDASWQDTTARKVYEAMRQLEPPSRSGIARIEGGNGGLTIKWADGAETFFPA